MDNSIYGRLRSIGLDEENARDIEVAFNKVIR
jgi:hypothetical protein